MYLFVLFLVFEEPHLPLDPSSISDEFATCSDHAMTGNDDDDTIVVVGPADSSYCFGISYHLRLFSIAASFSIGNCLESFPGIFLEGSSIDYERYIELFSLS